MSQSLEKRIIELDQPFSRVRISGAGRFAMTRGTRASVSITADRRIVDKAIVKVLDGTLYVRTERDVYDLDKIMFEPNYEIVTSDVNAIDVSEEMTGTVAKLREQCRLTLSGLANVIAEKVATTRLNIELGAASRLKMSGTIDLAVLELSGSSTVDARSLQAGRARVAVRGSATASVFVTQHLDADASGVGRIVYKGHPRLSQRTSGMGRIIEEN